MASALVALAAAQLSATGSGGGTPIEILIPARTACTDAKPTITLGVRYTNNPPGPRSFVVTVRDPTGRRVLYRSGQATKSWRIWRYRLDGHRRTGVYRSTYELSWRTEVFRTRLRRCSA